MLCVCARAHVFCPVWVDAVWECEFTDAEPLDSAIEDEIKEDVSVFKEVYTRLLPFSCDEENVQVTRDQALERQVCCVALCFVVFRCLTQVCVWSLQSVWNVFGENEVSVKSLIAVLASFILGAKSKTSSVEQRRHALQAASLYLLLLRIPGALSHVLIRLKTSVYRSVVT